MSISLKREAFIALQYFIFTLVAGTFGLLQWEEARTAPVEPVGEMAVCYSGKTLLIELLDNYYSSLARVFVALVLIRLSVLFILSLSRKSPS